MHVKPLRDPTHIFWGIWYWSEKNWTERISLYWDWGQKHYTSILNQSFPSGISLLKVNIETLEQSVKYIQS